MRWLYVYFPRLQLDCSMSDQGRTNPSVLVHRGQVVQANQAARACGIDCGTGLAQAALLCSHITIADYQLRQEQQLLKQLAQQLYQLSATLYLCPPQGLLFQTQDMSRLYNNQEHYWHSLQEPLRARHLSYYYAAAHTPLAAQILALAHANQFCQSLAEVERLLNQLPIAAAGLSQTLTAQLQRLGLHLLGQVRELSRPALGKKLGTDLVQHLQQLDQDQPPKVPVYRPKEYFSQQLPLLYEVEQSPALRFPLSRLLQDMEVFLHNRQLQVARLKLGLISRQQETIWLHIGSGGGEYLAKVWLELVMLRMEQITLKAPIISLHLKGCQQTARTALTQSLFEPSQGQKLTPGQLLGRLQNRLGEHAIQQLGLRHDYRPEHSAYSSQIATSISHKGNNLKHQPIDSLRPSILLPLPQMLTAKPGSGWQFLQGPERIQSGWWDNRAICRDYFIVRNSQGQLCWLFRNHQEEWFLHGYFA